MARAIAPNDDVDNCGLTYSELQELWLGPSHDGSCFNSREELVAAWSRGRSLVMRLWGSHGRRPQAWWEFDTDLKYPGYFRERSVLWRTPGVLSQQERTELECEWRREYDAARGMGARERRDHLAHHDVPDELIREWTAARKRRRRQPTPSQEEAAAK
jgi:hypothetical protein